MTTRDTFVLSVLRGGYCIDVAEPIPNEVVRLRPPDLPALHQQNISDEIPSLLLEGPIESVDSLFLLKHGMEVVSCDDAEAMLSYARSEKERLGLTDWDVKRANWLTLTEDLPPYEPFDAVLCLGSSILHLVDLPPELALHRKCLTNFKTFLKPGGLLLIDHRNMDSMLDRGVVVNRNIYHKEDTLPGVSIDVIEKDGVRQRVDIFYDMVVRCEDTGKEKIEKVIMPLAPVHVNTFSGLLKEMFGPNCKYSLYGDFNLQEQGDTENTVYFQHVVQE